MASDERLQDLDYADDLVAKLLAPNWLSALHSAS